MKKGISIILIVVGLILIIPSSVVTYQLSTQSSSYEILIPMSESMEPTFSKGAILKFKTNISGENIHAAPKDGCSPGDIIAFYFPNDPSNIICHRAVQKIENGGGTFSFRTMGDNNNARDWWVVQENSIVGKLVEINPPFWTYNLLFWDVLLVGGILVLALGIIVILVTR